jgi:hypothetical protein
LPAATGVAGDPRPLVLGRYRLLERLGSGGFGTVWIGRDETLGRDVAVKVVPAGEADDTNPRAGREAIAAARLNHPGIVTLYEAGEDDDAHYLVSELVHGETLWDLSRGGHLSDRDVALIGIALADALEHAHAKGVIHRDVKPQNVMIPDSPQSAAGIAKLTDFGVASLAGEDALTRTGDVVGTLAYMAPEQAEGARVGAPADLYALALVLYEALTGFNPVRANGAAATARRLGQAIAPLRRSRRDLPEELAAAIDRALAPEPRARGTLRQLRSALAATAPRLSDEPDRPGAPRALRTVAPRLVAALAAGALALAALSGLRLPGVDDGMALSIAGATALLVLALPRAGWALAASALVAWVLVPDGGGGAARPGLALVVAAGFALSVLLLARDGWTWSLPVAAPLLALAGAGAAFVALAGVPRRAHSRAGLGVAGLWWLLLAEQLSESDLYAGPLAGTTPPAAWEGSLSRAGSDAIAPIFSSGAVLHVLPWALGAIVLPWLVRGSSLVRDLAGAALWATALCLGEAAIAGFMSGPETGTLPLGTVPGAVLGGLAAVVAVRLLRRPGSPAVA